MADYYPTLSSNTSFQFLYVELCDDFSCSYPEIIWNCLPSPCKVSYGVQVALYVTLGILICLANITVLMVYTKRLRIDKQKNSIARSQLYYKLSLACADLLLGLIVCPCAVINFFINFKHRFTWQHLLANGRITNRYVSASYFQPSSLDTAYQTYYTVIGCITFTSWAVSCLTLMIASADRFFAIAYPFSYIKKQVFWSRFTIISIMCTWVAGVIVGLFPFFRDDTDFRGWTIILFVSANEGLIIFAVLIAIPLVGMWFFSALTFIVAKRQVLKETPRSVSMELHTIEGVEENCLSAMTEDKEVETRVNDSCPVMNTVSHNNVNTSHRCSKCINMQQRRLAVTLAIVVVTFTLAFLPVCIAMATRGVMYYDAHNSLVTWLAIVCLSNSFWNCVIYSIRNQEFRKDAAAIYIKIALGVKRAGGWIY
ncbi:unnamed protein product [Clavelina lepadiformis]|uniref:G-protein coupled receptors family 1 profile domain-containing protein n=1 Tax=Clavelina lepadiformis TaxID=159417 RepID=A0ABP0GYN8_CLALP